MEIGAISEVHLDEALVIAPPDGGDLHDTVYTDEMTGLPLRPSLVRQARREDMTYMEQMQVFRALTDEEARLGCRLALPTRFVDVDKGQLGAHAVPARLVVCETRGISKGLFISDTFSATPPHEALRVVLSLAMSEPNLIIGI